LGHRAKETAKTVKDRKKGEWWERDHRPKGQGAVLGEKASEKKRMIPIGWGDRKPGYV